MSEQGKNGEFYAKGKEIWKSPIYRRNEDDNADNIEVGFKVCTASEWIDPETLVGVFTEHAAMRSIASLQAENERMREALKPFAQIADIEHRAKDGETVMVNVSRCREARAALGSNGNG